MLDVRRGPELKAPRARARPVMALAVSCVVIVGCGSTTPTPEAPLASRLQEAVDGFLASRLVPGASVAVIEGGALVTVVSGDAELDSGRAVTPSTRFRVASVTKLYVATVVLGLVERSRLALDEPIGSYGVDLPETLEFARRLTLRQLLSHTSGLAQIATRDEDRRRSLTTMDLLERITPPVCAPGSCWSYSDGNFVLASAVIEAVTGQPLAQVVRDELVEPLGLRATEMVDAAVEDTILPAQYAVVSDESGEPLEPHRLFEQSLPRAATLVTTAADAARFADSLFRGDVLEPASLAQLLDSGVMADLPCPESFPVGYGLGVFHLQAARHALVGHDGSSGALVVHDQDLDLTVAILTNGGEQDMGMFLDVVLDAIDDPDG